MAELICSESRGGCKKCENKSGLPPGQQFLPMRSQSITHKQKCRRGLTFLDIALTILIVGFLAVTFIPTRYRTTPQRPEKACLTNLYLIRGAIELYNLDNNVSQKHITTELDDPTKAESVLVKQRYLKSPIKPPTKQCIYRINGNMLEGGFVSCDQHGTIDKIRKVE